MGRMTTSVACLSACLLHVSATPDGRECTSDSCAVSVNSLLQKKHSHSSGIFISDGQYPGLDGSPITCLEDEHKCDEDTGYPWCSARPCPINCNWDTEKPAMDNEWSIKECVNKKDDCPVDYQTCQDAWDTNGDYTYCKTTCPVTCDWETETVCYADDGTESCVDASKGCPITCPKDEHKCDEDKGYPWCSRDPCPMNCNWETEKPAIDKQWNVKECVNKNDDCPVDYQTCQDAFDTNGDYTYCKTTCPLYCNWETEKSVYDEDWNTIECLDATAVCPEKYYTCNEEYGVGHCQVEECYKYASLVATVGKMKSNIQGASHSKGKGKMMGKAHGASRTKGKGKGKGKK